MNMNVNIVAEEAMKDDEIEIPVQINGKTYVAEDVGGGVKGKHIDVFFKSHKQTKRFGKKTGVKVNKVN